MRDLTVALWKGAVVYRTNMRDAEAQAAIAEAVRLVDRLRQGAHADAGALRLYGLISKVYAQVLGDLERYPESFTKTAEVSTSTAGFPTSPTTRPVPVAAWPPCCNWGRQLLQRSRLRPRLPELDGVGRHPAPPRPRRRAHAIRPPGSPRRAASLPEEQLKSASRGIESGVLAPSAHRSGGSRSRSPTRPRTGSPGRR